MKIHRIDHIGINVRDLAAAKAFFLDLGLEVQGEAEVEAEWVGRVIGLDNVKSALVMMGVPGGQGAIELVQFISPLDEAANQQLPANALGIRHVTFLVDDVEATVARLQKRGAELMGEIHAYEGIYKTCYIRGPEGIILELAEQLQ